MRLDLGMNPSEAWCFGSRAVQFPGSGMHGGSWVFISRVISRVTILITLTRGHV